MNQLQAIIRAYRGTGLTDRTIYETLAAIGYPTQTLREAFAALDQPEWQRLGFLDQDSFDRFEARRARLR